LPPEHIRARSKANQDLQGHLGEQQPLLSHLALSANAGAGGACI